MDYISDTYLIFLSQQLTTTFVSDPVSKDLNSPTFIKFSNETNKLILLLFFLLLFHTEDYCHVYTENTNAHPLPCWILT